MRNLKAAATMIVRALLVLVLGVAPVTAQDHDARRGLFLGGGVSFTQGSTHIGGDTGSKFGIGLPGVVAGVKSNGFRSFSVDLQIEPASPDAFVWVSGGEEISTTSLGLRILVGRQVGGGRDT